MHKDSTNFKEILELIDDFKGIHEVITKDNPKELNFLNEIKINEVEHSRILYRLFDNESKENQKSLFKLFMDKLCEKENSFSDFNDGKYVFKLEKYNIDLLVLKCASNKAMIIENKINEAIDQNQQLERYVEVCRSLGYDENDIYIVYLTRYGGSPSSESLNPDLSARFNNRIALISYSDFMIEWLESLLNTSYLQEDNTLIQNVKLYADHLKTELGINSRTQIINKEMIKEVENLFCLDKSSDPLDNLDKLKNIEFNINEFQVVLKELKVKVQHELYAKNLKKSSDNIFKINKDNVVCESFNSHYYVGYKAKIKSNVFYIILEDNLGDRPYFGFRKCKEDDSLIPDLRTDLKQIFKEDFNEVGWWYAYKFVDKDYDEFKQFESFLKTCLNEEFVEVIKP